MTHPPTARRSSPGGHVVSDSLASAGFTSHPLVTLVETVPPARSPYSAVLCQNAWNFLPRDEYSHLIRSYAPPRRALYRARRTVAGLNVARAGTNVTLSVYMRDLLAARGRRTTLAPVTLPWDLCTAEEVAAAGTGAFQSSGTAGVTGPSVDRPFVLVPGTLTHYKNPTHALDLVARMPTENRPLVIFAGTDDGSGCHQTVRERADARGIEAWIGPVDRPAMKWLLVHATVTLIPSRLESLSLSVCEALLLSPRVAATPLPVHREMAGRLGREPVWLTDDPAADLDEIFTAQGSGTGLTDVAVFRDQWFDLSRVLTTLAEGTA